MVLIGDTACKTVVNLGEAVASSDTSVAIKVADCAVDYVVNAVEHSTHTA